MVYAAEKKQETMSFFDPKFDPNDLERLEKQKVGNEFLHSQNWGEQLSDVRQPVICIATVASGTISVLDNLFQGIAPGQVKFFYAKFEKKF